jgi:2-dehydro-3-deoxyphosphogluconate aldolase/(4S)-4-hydroxy-2-oxoglutarate aldolase
MEKAQVISRIRELGLVPVVRTPSADDALAMAEALHAAALSNLEITLTVPGALEVISELNARFGADMIIGAGSVLDAAAAEACVKAGAQFVVSPGFDLQTVSYCKAVGVAVFPGAITPTEVITAWRAGADIVKIFPASAVGGASYLKALKAPLPQIEMMPTGGVSVETAAAFIQAGAAALGVGGDLVDLKALRSGRTDVIAERARLYIEIVRQARG